MSKSSDRGKDFEKRLARMIRTKLKLKAVRDSRSGAGDTYKADIAVPGLAWSIEAKSQETIKIREWWQQCQSASPIYKSPMLAIELNGEALAVVSFEDILNLIKTIQDDTQTITDLRTKLNRTSSFLE